MQQVINNQKSGKLVEGLFKNHFLHVKHNYLVPVEHVNNNSIFYIILIIIGILLLFKYIYEKRINDTFLALFSSKSYNNLQNEKFIIIHPLNIVLTIFFIVLTSIIISIVKSNSFENMNDWSAKLATEIAVFITLFLSVKVIIAFLFKYIYSIKKATKYYINYTTISYNLMSIGALLGLLMMLAINTNTGILFTLILFTIIYIINLSKLVLLLYSKIKLNSLHFIIYLCTVEILPLIIMVKLYFINVY